MSFAISSQSYDQRDPNQNRDSYGVSQRLWDEALNHPAERFLSNCGKRVRAAIVNESYRVSGGHGDAPQQISDAIELLHAGSLIVDDIEDDSAERRGQPTLHREIGIPLALNTGNWMYFRSLEKLSEVTENPVATHKILTQVIRTVRRCHEGQALDLSAAVDLLDPSEIYPTAREISRLKTGGLTALSSWLGSIAAGACPVTQKALRRFGMNVGVCLQMYNDLNELRLFSEGERRYDDLRNARVTWPFAWASKKLTPSQMRALQQRMRHSFGDANELLAIAQQLLSLVGKRGYALIEAKLERELTLLGEHVDSTRSMRSALSKLRQSR
ncbi:MAG: polyprenyl synthetase family protein [Planctomycetota bacterium]